MNSKIKELIESLNIASIPTDRLDALETLVNFIQQKKSKQSPIHLNFICSHNSRRSHLSQVWAQALAHYYGVGNVWCYSGGTETTALFPSASQALKSSGFIIEQLSEGKNPIYAIKFDENTAPVIGFSKTYDAAFNPSSQFAAVMTCSSADENCPFIPGAEQRIPITYEDPKVYDGTAQEEEKYLERSLQIATELKYVFSNIE